MKRILISIMSFCALAISINGQTDPVSSQFMFNRLIYNPASAGSSGQICATAMNRQQWVGFEGAPVSTIFHANGAFKPFGLSTGLGISIINDKTGFDTDNSIALSWSYMLSLGQGKLGIGISAGMLNKSIDPDWNIPSGDLFVPATGDPLIPDGKESFLAFDMGAGLYYSSQNFYAGLSVTHLNEPKIKYTEGTPYIARQYYAMAGYNIRLSNPAFELLPAALVYSDGSLYQATISTLLRYNKKVWGGVSYRAGDSFIGIFGIELYNGIRIGYSYDFPLNDIRKSTSGSHEFLVNYCFDLSLGRNSMRYKSIRFL